MLDNMIRLATGTMSRGSCHLWATLTLARGEESAKATGICPDLISNWALGERRPIDARPRVLRDSLE